MRIILRPRPSGEPFFMSTLTRNAIFEQASKKLRADFEELSLIPHRGAKGKEAEDLMKAFLNNHLPKRFNVGSGFIIDRQDNVSKQTDVVIYDAFNCPIYRASEDAAIFPSDNVAAVVEVKSRLDKEQLILACKNIQATKRLAKTPVSAGLPFIVQTQTIGCLFAYDSAISLNTITEHYHEYLNVEGFSTTDHIDIITVLDQGIVTFAVQPRGQMWAMAFMDGLGGPTTEGTHIGFGIQKLGKATLDAFFRLILGHLIYFRGMVDHPGLSWSASSDQGNMAIKYLASITYEKDPEKKIEILRQYKEEVKKDFEINSIPYNWE